MDPADPVPSDEVGPPDPLTTPPSSRSGPGTGNPNLEVTNLDLGGDVVFVTDRNGTIVDVNEAFVRVTGYSRREAIGAKPSLLSSGYQDAEFYAEMWQTILAGEVWEGQLIDRRRDGMLRTHRATISPVRDDSGQLTHFVAVERDVTGELGRQVSTGSTGLVHTDRDARGVYADGRAAALLDLPPSELLGPGLLSALDQDDADSLREVIVMSIDSGREHRLDLQTRSGRWLRAEVAPLSVSSGTIIGATCSLEDISELMALRTELDRNRAMVASVLDALDDAMAIVDDRGCVVTINQAWREGADEGDDPLRAVTEGDDVRAVARRAADAGDERAAALLEDLDRVLTGLGRGRRHQEGILVSPLGWDEGGAVLRVRPAG
jgi:PAS domain S-box-containing protein